MAITEKQIALTQEFRSRLRDEIKECQQAPDDVKEPLDYVWQAFKDVAEFDDDSKLRSLLSIFIKITEKTATSLVSPMNQSMC